MLRQQLLLLLLLQEFSILQARTQTNCQCRNHRTGLIGVASASVVANRLVSLTTVNDVTLTASVWVDASYEGDLAFAAGASMVWGRESNTTYATRDRGVIFFVQPAVSRIYVM